MLRSVQSGLRKLFEITFLNFFFEQFILVFQVLEDAMFFISCFAVTVVTQMEQFVFAFYGNKIQTEVRMWEEMVLRLIKNFMNILESRSWIRSLQLAVVQTIDETPKTHNWYHSTVARQINRHHSWKVLCRWFGIIWGRFANEFRIFRDDQNPLRTNLKIAVKSFLRRQF